MMSKFAKTLYLANFRLASVFYIDQRSESTFEITKILTKVEKFDNFSSKNIKENKLLDTC